MAAGPGCMESAKESAPLAAASGASENEPVVVRVLHLEERTLGRMVHGLGRCEALPQQLAVLTPVVEGRVAGILVDEGRPVVAGQPIVELDRSLADADLREKVATRDSLTAATALLESVPRTAEQAPQKLAVEQARIAVARAAAIVEQLQPLRSRHEVSEQQVFDAEQALELAKVQQQSAEAQLEVLMLAPREEALAEARSKTQVAEQAVKLSQVRRDLHTVASPIDGVLDSLTCHPGQTIAIGAAIGVVIDSRQLLSTTWLPVTQGAQVRVGQSATVRITAPAWGATGMVPARRDIAGQVIFVGRIADAQTGNMPVKVLVENAAGDLVIGQTVEVAIRVEEPQTVLAAPLAAIYDSGEGMVLTVVRDGKAAVLHPELGLAEGDWIAVSGAELQAGEPVVVEGGYQLPDGTPVTTAKAAPENRP